MPRVFRPVDITQEEKEVRKDYFDRHTPRIICPETVERGYVFCIKVIIGEQYTHPVSAEHFTGHIQLWNRETLLAETRYSHEAMAGKEGNVEVDFYITAPEVSMNLTVMSYCTRHGLWTSDPKAVKVVG